MTMITLAKGPHLALNRAILEACLPGAGIVPQLLDGTPKVLMAFWCGGVDGDLESYDEARGDGGLRVLRPGDRLYFPQWYLQPEHNIRAGVPLWLVRNEPHQEFDAGTVLAMGLLHPLYASATIRMYHPETGEAQDEFYLSDPRVAVNQAGRLLQASELTPERRATQPNPAEWVPPHEQRKRLTEMGGLSVELPPHAPEFQQR